MNLFGFLAFLVPLPLFYDLSSQAFVLHPVEHNNILIEAGIPIPIGLLSVALIILFSFSRTTKSFRIHRETAAALVFLAIFYLHESSRATSLKLFAVLLPTLMLLTFCTTLTQPRIVGNISKGYLAGVAFQTVLHTTSILFYSLAHGESLVLSARSFFGYEIYQAYISYSAIFSTVGAALVIYALAPRDILKRLLLLTMAAPVYIVVISATRKAALADMVFIFLINAFLMLRSIRFPKIYMIRKKFFTNAFIFILLTSVACVFVLFSPRDISLNFALEQRSGNYVSVLNRLPTLSVAELLLGHETGWGGYSNLFVELFVRSGILGMFTYLSGLALALKRFRHALIASGGDAAHALSNDIFVTCWFAFALASFLVGNLVNEQIQLPYYTTNFLMINICFIFHYTQRLREAPQTSTSEIR